MIVSPDTIALLTTMKHAWRQTDGLYDPTMLAAINAAGYSTSIDGSSRDEPDGGRRRSPGAPSPTWRSTLRRRP